MRAYLNFILKNQCWKSFSVVLLNEFIRAVLNSLFFYENILHAPAPKAPKAQKAQKAQRRNQGKAKKRK